MRTSRLTATLLALSVAGAACSGESAPITPTTTSAPATEVSESITSTGVEQAPGPTPVIVDYSPTVSDVGGLMYLLAHPEVEVIAISLPVTGEAGCELGIKVATGLLALLGQEHVPVACDPTVPPHARQWPAAFLSGHEDLLFTLPEGSAPVSDNPAELIAEAASGAGQPVVIWAVAPLTNVSRALSDNPGLVDHVERIVVMGGAVDAQGNVEGTAAEWNFWIDAPAAAHVIASGVPVTLVPLDATNEVPVPNWYRTALADAPQSDSIVYLDRMVRLFPSVTSGFFYMWDELAAVVVVDESVVTTDQKRLVVVEGGVDDGRSLAIDEGRTITVATGVVDPDGFYAEFLSTLAGAAVDIGGSATPQEELYFVELRNSLSQLRKTLEEILGDPKLADGAEFDAEHVAAVFEQFLDAIEVSRLEMLSVSPPESLQDVHDEYMEMLAAIAESKNQIMADMGLAKDWVEADALFAQINVFAPCGLMDEQAALLGLEGVCE